MTEPATHPLISGHPPPWACGWGRDRHGVFAEFRLGEVRQCMRWIPPGSFWMGSPESEEGRTDREGPQRLVTLSEGFWLADTPCTQELWQEIKGSNPSRFGDRPRNPVEQVSWEEVRLFFDALAERLSRAEPRFPTEAEWEYACRAGHDTATWVGDLQPSERAARKETGLLDSIAWYFGTQSGQLGTHEVKLKAPNPWGLYDMLGNVREWVADPLTRYDDAESVDPLAEAKEGEKRVFRGSAWNSLERDVRAAFRLWADPGHRTHSLGFRLSLGPSSGAERRAGSRRPAPGSASERGTSLRDPAAGAAPGRDSGGGG